MSLRVNLARTTREQLRESLLRESIESAPGTIADSALTLSEPRDVAALPGFDEGLLSVQDEAAQLAATLLAPRAGEKILDACAAPGGKTAHLLEIEPNCDLLACDISESRLERVRENLARLGLGARLLAADVAHPTEELERAAPFDAMLVDAPCSATGVVRRHPDIKVLRKATDVAGFAAQQLAILEGLWPLLKPGGRLLYVTCSILPEENELLLETFRSRHQSIHTTEIAVPSAQARGAGQQLLPDSGGTDGLFFALLRKAG